MDFKAVQHALIERLKERIGEAEIAAFPQTQNGEMPGLLHAKADVLVRYLGANLSVPAVDGSQVIQQVASEQYETLVRTRNHSPKSKAPNAGALDLVVLVQNALRGYTVPDVAQASILYVLRRQFIEEVEGIWVYSIIWQFTVPEVTT
jgi:hypothetical protein